MEPLRSLILKVELLVGTSIHLAARDLCALAERLGVMVEANCNGVVLHVCPGDDPQTNIDKYHADLYRIKVSPVTKFSHKASGVKEWC